MSYILEALADSEQARERSAATPRYSLLPVASEEAPRGRRWPYVLVGVLLLNAAVLQAWLRPNAPGAPTATKVASVRQPAHTAVAAAKPAIKPSTGSAQPAAKIGEAAPVSQQFRPSKDHNWRVLRPVAAAESAPRAAAKVSAKSILAIPALQTAPSNSARRAAQGAVVGGAKPAPAQTPAREQAATLAAGAGSRGEMSPEMQRELPVLAVAGFIRNEGVGSMVIVNDRLVREGEEVAPGVKLEQIVNDSLVFSYKGHRFTR